MKTSTTPWSCADVFGALDWPRTSTDPARRAVLDDLCRSSAPDRPAWSWPGRSASSRRAASRATSALIDPAAVRVMLIDGGKEHLARFGGELSAGVRHGARKMGVELGMGRRSSASTPSASTRRRAEGEEALRVRDVIWAAGVEASPLARVLAEATGAKPTVPGGSRCSPTSPCPGIPRSSPWATWRRSTTCRLCEVAMQGGLHAANTIKRRRQGQESGPFKYQTWGARQRSGASRRS